MPWNNESDDTFPWEDDPDRDAALRALGARLRAAQEPLATPESRAAREVMGCDAPVFSQAEGGRITWGWYADQGQQRFGVVDVHWALLMLDLEARHLAHFVGYGAMPDDPDTWDDLPQNDVWGTWEIEAPGVLWLAQRLEMPRP